MKKVVAVAVVVAVAAGGLWYANNKAEQVIIAQLEQANQSYAEMAEQGLMPGVISLGYESVSANVLTSSYQINGMSVSLDSMGQLVLIEQIVAKGIKPKGLSDKGSVLITGVKATPAALQMLPDTASSFLQDMVLHADYHYHYHKDGLLDFSQELRLNDEFTLGYKFTLSQLQSLWQYAEEFNELPEAEQLELSNSGDFVEIIMPKLMEGALNSGEIIIKNKGFIERVVALSAEQGESPPLDALRGVALMMISTDQTLPAEIKDSLIAFVNNPEKLQMAFKFNSPLKFEQLQQNGLPSELSSPEALIEFANLKLTAN